MVFGVPSLEHVCIQFLNGTVDESPVARKNRILRKQRSDGCVFVVICLVIRLTDRGKADCQPGGQVVRAF